MSKKQKKFKKAKKPVVTQVFPEQTTQIKFPSIPRSIPEIPSLRILIVNKVFVVNFLCGFFAMAIALFGLQVKSHMAEVEALKAKKAGMLQERVYWESIISKYPTYRDGYFKLATVEYRLGNVEKSHEYTKKVLAIDPEYKPALLFESQLKNY